MPKIYVYETPRIRLIFTDSDGNPVTPDNIRIAVVAPNGSVLTYTGGELTETTTGVYDLYYPVTESGKHYVWGQGYGTISSIEQRHFTAYESIPALQT